MSLLLLLRTNTTGPALPPDVSGALVPGRKNYFTQRPSRIALTSRSAATNTTRPKR